jgi:hypothetical protein
MEDRIRIAQAVQGDLESRGLCRAGNVQPQVLDALRLLADHQVAIAVMGTVDGGKEIYARASATARQGVLAKVDQQMINFDLIQPDSLARAVIGLLPAMRPGPGQSVMISKAAPAPPPRQRGLFEEADEGFFAPVRAARTGSTAQMQVAEEILRKPRKGSGFFVVTGRNARGKEVTAPGLSWIDTEDGRYLMQTREGDDGQTHATFAPADQARLAHQLNDLMRGVIVS